MKGIRFDKNLNWLQQYLLTFLHKPYIWGGDDPIHGLDCSGLVQEVYSALGIDPTGDQTAQGLYNYFVSRSSRILSPGALCFYGKSIYEITHVAIAFDENLIIEAGGGGSKTQTPSDAIKQNAYIRLRPRLRRKDFLTCILPAEIEVT